MLRISLAYLTKYSCRFVFHLQILISKVCFLLNKNSIGTFKDFRIIGIVTTLLPNKR